MGYAGRPKSAITTKGARHQQPLYSDYTYDENTLDDEEDSLSDAESQASFASLRSMNGRRLERQRYEQTLGYYGVVRLPRQYWEVQVRQV